MATRKLSLSKLLRRRHHNTLRTIYSSISSSSLSNPSSPSSSIESHHFTNTSHRYSSTHNFHSHGDNIRFLTPYKFLSSSLSSSSSYRSFSTNRENPKELDATEGEDLSGSGFIDYDYDAAIAGEVSGAVSGGDAAIAGEVSGAVSGGEEAILPVRCLIWFMDGVHDLTGMPWWMVIISSTLALRVAILPVLLVQLNKLKEFAELAPKLPPPFPPPFSGKSWIKQLKHFRNKAKEIGSPSFLWVLAYPSVQIPCFILGTSTVRRMALDHHPGFECGGTLWFQNLTELSHGASGYIFPLLIASLHLASVLVAFDKSTLTSLPNSMGMLAKYYKFYLQFLTIPLLFVGFYLPQGSLLYWSASSSLTLVQQLALRHPRVRDKLRLPNKKVPEDSGNSKDLDGLEATFTVPMFKKTVQDLSPKELFHLSIIHLSKGENDKAVPLLRLALEKDPENVGALITMGVLLTKDEKLIEATEYLERAITKLLLDGHPTEAEEIDHLIQASTYAGVAYAKQGNVAEGIVHLERIANMKEPEDMKIKAHYCDGLFVLSSALASVGRDDEAAKYLRILTTYDPAYGEYLKQLENGEDNFADDLVNSRRRDF